VLADILIPGVGFGELVIFLILLIIGAAEDCEQHCGTLGYASAEIRRKAVRVPKIEIMPLR
jgi:hypothetical protein